MIDRLDMARRLPENRGPVQQFAITNALRMLSEAGVKDPGWPAEHPLPQTPQENLLEKAIAEYRRGSITPAVVTNYWRAKLPGIEVPDCDWTEEAVRRPMKDVRGKDVPGMMVYHPQEFLGKEGLVRLSQMYPYLRSYSVGGDTPITDTHTTTGWIKVEAVIDAPNLNTTQRQLEELAIKRGYLGQRATTYILAGQASRDLTGRYLDEVRTYTRLLGSRRGSKVVDARFGSDGYLDVGCGLEPGYQAPSLGGRFEEVKRA